MPRERILEGFRFSSIVGLLWAGKRVSLLVFLGTVEDMFVIVLGLSSDDDGGLSCVSKMPGYISLI